MAARSSEVALPGPTPGGHLLLCAPGGPPAPRLRAVGHGTTRWAARPGLSTKDHATFSQRRAGHGLSSPICCFDNFHCFNQSSTFQHFKGVSHTWPISKTGNGVRGISAPGSGGRLGRGPWRRPHGLFIDRSPLPHGIPSEDKASEWPSERRGLSWKHRQEHCVHSPRRGSPAGHGPEDPGEHCGAVTRGPAAHVCLVSP